MAAYILKSKSIKLTTASSDQITIGRFYSGDRFYTLLNEYIDINLHKKNKLMAWIIKILFKSSNFKHDPGIANGQPWSIKLFDFFCVVCLILFIIFSLGVIGLTIPVVMGFVNGKFNQEALETMWKTLIGIGVPAVVTGIPAILWLVIFFTIRKKNKPLSLQAYVEKKIAWCLKLRFLIKNVKIQKDKSKTIFLLENFEAQGASGARWLNIQMINLVCSIFTEFNYVFRFESLSDEEIAELEPIMNYDFRMVELIKADDIQWNVWNQKQKKNLFKKSKEDQSKN